MEQGLILGRYRLLAEIGEGGHGAVDLAYDTKMSRRVAVKRIRLSEGGILRLSRTTGLAEARTAALLNHPNVVTVHEWDTDEDEAFLIMEYVDGVPLAELLDAYAPLDVDEAAAIMGPACAALSFAHANGILHLDLKPENVLVTRDGLVKVADFGVASLTNAAGQALSAGGTLGYMPPEQLRGDPVDARSDVWALGAIAYETLTGAVPFAADNLKAAIYKAENVAPPMPGEFIEGLPPVLDDVLAAALSAMRMDRPASAEALADEMLPFLGDPEAGRSALRELVAALLAEQTPEALVPLGLWDRLTYREALLRRAVCGLAAAGMTGIAIGGLGLGWPPAIGAAAIAGAAGAFASPYGLAVGMLALAASAFAIGWPYGLLVGVLGVAWWTLLGRHAGWDSLAPLGAPLFGVLGVSPALPLLTGFFVRNVWRAFASGAATGAVLVLASVASGRPPASMSVDASFLMDPLGQLSSRGLAFTTSEGLSALAIVVAWGAAAAVGSLLARRATRASALLGAGAGSMLLVAVVGPWLTGGQRVTSQTALQFGLSSILVAVVVALGPPVAEATSD